MLERNGNIPKELAGSVRISGIALTLPDTMHFFWTHAWFALMEYTDILQMRMLLCIHGCLTLDFARIFTTCQNLLHRGKVSVDQL